MHQYLIIDVTESLYYHQLSDSTGNLSVVSDEDFEVFSSSEDSIRKHELEIEHYWGP